MVMVQEKDVKKYLTDLGERLKHVNTDLADIISSEDRLVQIHRC